MWLEITKKKLKMALLPCRSCKLTEQVNLTDE